MRRIWTDWRTTLVGLAGTLAGVLAQTWGAGSPLTLETAAPLVLPSILGMFMKDGK